METRRIVKRESGERILSFPNPSTLSFLIRQLADGNEDKKHTPIFLRKITPLFRGEFLLLPLLACPVKFEEYFTGDRRGQVYPVKFSWLNISTGGEPR